MKKILITGVSGFIGARLMSHLQLDQSATVIGIRRTQTGEVRQKNIHAVGDLQDADISNLLVGVDVVIHAAARAHVAEKKSPDSLDEFRGTNVFGSLNLARQSAEAGVRRLIFLSSIGVNGARTLGRPFSADDLPFPAGNYAKSKFEAESILRKFSNENRMELVIIRLPLVYGKDAPGNFGRLVSSIERGTWLPLGAVHNRRTLIGIDNLVDLICMCIWHPAAAGQIFLAGDTEEVSTTELLQLVGSSIGRPARLLPVPMWVIRFAGRVFGKSDLVEKICGDLQIDISKARTLLGWEPPFSIREGLATLRR